MGPSSRLQSDLTSSTSCTPTSERTLDRPPESRRLPASRPLPSPGVPVERLLESHECEVAEPTDPARPLSVTCAEAVGCSLHSRPGGDGTKSVTSTSDDTPLQALSLPLVFQLWLWPRATEWTPFQRSRSSSPTTPRTTRRPSRPSICSSSWALGTM